MATQAQTTFHASHFTLHEMRAQKPLFMQNKAKLPTARMNATSFMTKDYENETLGERGKNKPKTNPNKANLLLCSNERKLSLNKVLWK